MAELHQAIRIPSRDPRLGRNINHDPRSRRFPYRQEVPIVSVRHQAHIGILNQGNLGACTGFAGIGCLGRGGFYATINEYDVFQLTHDGGVHLYSAATKIDPFAGEYPPEDTGSDGLSIAKVLVAAGQIAGYEWAFTLQQALWALMNRPVITGIYWYDGMFDPDREGIIHPTGRIAGGHEVVVDEYDSARGLVGGPNSWDDDWGLDGRWYMPDDEYGDLLDQHGDVTIFTPSPEFPPVPEPTLDEEFADVLHDWLDRRPYFYKQVQHAARLWLTERGL
jgi:hypothetical protein